jgi:hypothetical protein
MRPLSDTAFDDSLIACFDESGTHNQYGHQVTLVSGFIGSAAEWNLMANAWHQVMGGKTFHYKDYRLETDLLAQLADIIAARNLIPISAGFCGDWEKAISHGDGWSVRFPSCYHMVFEQCLEHVNRLSDEHWNSKPVVLMFSRQNEYAARAHEVWRTTTGNGLWPNLTHFGFQDPSQFPHLQAADMIAHETFQCLKSGTDIVWKEWPLVRRLLDNQGKAMFGGHHSNETFIVMMERSEREGRKYLKTVLELKK